MGGGVALAKGWQQGLLCFLVITQPSTRETNLTNINHHLINKITKEKVMNQVNNEISSTEMSEFAKTIYKAKYAWRDEEGNVVEDWAGTARRVVTNVLGALGYDDSSEEFTKLYELVRDRKFLPGGRYLYASGRDLHQTQNCLLLKAEDSREGWADLLKNSAMALQTGAGIGVDYSDIRPSGTIIKRTGGVASGPIPLMKMINEIGRGVMQGGARRSAIWAGLNWAHPDCEEFIRIKDWRQEVRDIKEKDFNFPADMEFTNVSILLDDEFFAAYEDKGHEKHKLAHHIYHLGVQFMVKTAEPGFSVDIGENAGETLRNACTEVTSHDDSDICNLGSINLARIETIEEMEEVVKYGTLFLLAGTVYSDLPYDKVNEVREKNRRLGLGVMGIHEWLLKRGKKYEPDTDLGEWLDVYATSGDLANEWADQHGLNHPIKTRAIAPTGTIGIIAETTTGVEPIFCVAFKRRYKEAKANGEDIIRYQYVIDPTAKRLIDEGVDPDAIEDAYILSYTVEKRIAMQAWVQQYVDHGISSTINLPYPITDPTEVADFADLLYGYLPQLRGITCYPDGARGGQPLTISTYEEAKDKVGVVFEETEERCVGGLCGT
jgi:ribonucleoside-diphosphate reductase alpha chain